MTFDSGTTEFTLKKTWDQGKSRNLCLTFQVWSNFERERERDQRHWELFDTLEELTGVTFLLWPLGLKHKRCQRFLVECSEKTWLVVEFRHFRHEHL